MLRLSLRKRRLCDAKKLFESFDSGSKKYKRGCGET
jgi:hypothetical protein